MLTDKDCKTWTRKSQLHLATKRSLVNLARAISVKVPHWSKLETEGEAEGINTIYEEFCYKKEERNVKDEEEYGIKEGNYFKIRYVTACMMTGMA